MMKKRVFNRIINEFKTNLNETKNGNSSYNKAIEITIERIEKFCNFFLNSSTARYGRTPFLNELNKIKCELRKARKNENSSEYNHGVKVVVDKIKDLQKNLLYEHEKNPKSTLYYKDII
jgi:uncharacterized coiled-coil DUF342 family protein